jgi:N-glycosylase/DNA lyase
MLTDKSLKAEYLKKKAVIRRRLKTFQANGDVNIRFLELCFCLCTAQSKASKVAKVINHGNLEKLLHYDWDDLSRLLRANTRFHNNKARYIIMAREYMAELGSLPKQSIAAREFLVKSIKGLGYKEASHFLRNIGYRDICIIDRHVINLMHELAVFKTRDPPKNPRQYLKMESDIKSYAKKVGIDVDELDLLLWSIKTGYVFK